MESNPSLLLLSVRAMRYLIIVVVALSSLVGCVDDAQWSSMDLHELAYSKCASAAWSPGFTRANYAEVAGVNSDGRAACFISGNHPSLTEAVRRATASCKAQYGRCYVFAENGYRTLWADDVRQRGYDEPDERYYSELYGPRGGGLSGLNQTVGALSTAVGSYNTGAMSMPTTSPPGGGGGRECPDIACNADPSCPARLRSLYPGCF